MSGSAHAEIGYLSRSLVDEGDSGSRVSVTIAHATPATAVEVEVHVADDEPSTAEHTLDMGDMTVPAGALHSRREDRRRARCGRATRRDAARTRRVCPVPRGAQQSAI